MGIPPICLRYAADPARHLPLNWGIVADSRDRFPPRSGPPPERSWSAQRHVDIDVQARLRRADGDYRWTLLSGRHREQPRFAVIGYGKLGGKELGYGSDLDVVFLFDDDDERLMLTLARHASKVIEEEWY